jgi:hypothetical protein
LQRFGDVGGEAVVVDVGALVVPAHGLQHQHTVNSLPAKGVATSRLQTRKLGPFRALF